MSFGYRLLGFAIVLGASGCNPSNASPAPSQSALSGGGTLPCDVQAVFNDACIKCHGDAAKGQGQRQATPMSLLTWADTQQELANSDEDVTDHTTKEPIYQRIEERIHDSASPMPPITDSDTLSPAQIATLDSWIGNNAPQGGGSCQSQQNAGGGSGAGGGSYGYGGGSNAGGGTVGAGGSVVTGAGGEGTVNTDAGAAPPPPPDECIPIDLHAQADASGKPFPVPAGTSELYQCFSFHVDLQGATQGLSFVRKIDNAQVIHHWLLYGMSTPQTNGASTACIGAHPDGALLAGWAPGANDWILPANVGLELGTGDFILEVHYNNYTGTDQTDMSGVEICGAKTPRENTASISWLGNDVFGAFGVPGIPPSTQDAPISGNCVPQISSPVHIIKSWPHMHKRGRRMVATITRAGSSTPEPFFDEPFDFNNQTQYDFPTIINPGDSILTTCHFQNTDPFEVGFGEKTTDEMCFNFTVAYPAHALVQPGINSAIHKDECISAAP